LSKHDLLYQQSPANNIHRLFWVFSARGFELRVEPWRVFYRVQKSWLSLSWSGAKGQRLVDRWKGVRIMKIESLREVKAKLSKIIKELPSEKSVVIAKNGRPCAVPFDLINKQGLTPRELLVC
jgi:hypothetical protein